MADKKLLKEELNRFKLMTEYAFYEDRAEDSGMIVDAEEEIGDGEPMDDIDGLGDGGGEPTDGGEDLGLGDEEAPMDDPEELDLEDPEGETDEPLGVPEEPIAEPEDDAVELDITQLVQGTEEAKMSADAANDKIEQLMNMVAKLEGQVSHMDDISSKIDSLNGQMEKRLPTEDEKLEMRSLDSAPYNLKLTDFWSQQEGKYDIMNQEEEKEEYTLNKNDIEGDYTDSSLKDSFDNSYEEEDI